MARNTTTATLEEVEMGYATMLAIGRKSDAWRYDAGAPDRWVNTETDEVVTAATPEGVPEGYVYVAPDEEVGDEYDVTESPQGATYRSPEPVDDSEDSDTDADGTGDIDVTGDGRAANMATDLVEQGGFEISSTPPEHLQDILGDEPETEVDIEFDPAEPTPGFKAETEIPVVDSADNYGNASFDAQADVSDFADLQAFIGTELGPGNVSERDWWAGVSEDTIDGMVDAIESGDGDIPMPYIEIGKDGGLRSTQEGRHRTLAAQQAGLETIPFRVLVNKDRDSDTPPLLDGDAVIQGAEVGSKATPEGVPEGYVYVAPDEEVGDEYDVTESPQGATYRSPNPKDDADDGGSDLPGDPPDDMSAFEARNYIFDHSGPLDSDTFNDNEDAAVAIVEAGNADPEVAAEALLEMSDASGDGFNMLGQNMAGRVVNAITGPTKYGVNIPYKTSGFDYARGEAVDEFNEEYPEQVTRVVDDAVNEWQLGMFAKETAPVFQLAAEQKDNETLPEGGRFGDDEYIDGVLEMPVTYEEKEAIRAKQEQTQEMLREAFGDEITVFRGQSTSDTNPTRADPSDAPARMKEAAKDGDTVEHEHRPAESWTTDPGYAAFYSNPAKDDRRVDPSDTDGVLMRTTVPVEDVVMAAHTTEMEPRESEVVLAHEETAEYEPDQLIPDDEVTNQKLVEEALRTVIDDDGEGDGVEQAADDVVRVDAEDVDPEWLHRDPEGSDEYDPVETKATPEGVPDDYTYLPPGEEAPDDHDVVVSDHGGRYVSTEPTDDADDTGGADDRIDIEDATTSAEVGEALGFGAPVHEVAEAGDRATFDVSDVPGFARDTVDAPISFIDSDWVAFEEDDGQEMTVGVETIRDVDVPPERVYDGEELLDETVPDAEPSDLAGGVAAAIDDSRDDFHDIRNAITGADSPDKAAQIAADELTDDELSALVDEVQTQDRIRKTWDTVDDAGDLRFGQPILYDADRPKRGTVDDIDADGTVWLYDEARDMRSGINPDFGTIYADPEYDDVGEEVFTADPGRYGLASNPDVLENAFEAAGEAKGSREAGIQGGNTTGDKMKVLEMPDGSRAFATPLDAYPGTTGVVKSRAEARENNLNSPDVIESLGGTAANTRVTEGPDGREYIVKEGVPGQTVSEYTQRGGDASESVKESAAETMSAAYFTGNVDLHGGNMVVNTDTGEVAVIDHDSAGYSSKNGFGAGDDVPDLSRYDSGPPGISTFDQDPRGKIYEKAQQIRSGEVDLGYNQRFAEDAADKAVRAAYVDPSYDLPDDQVPAELQFPPSGIESLDDFDDPNDVPDDFYEVTFVDGNGDVSVGEVKDVVDDDGEQEMIVENTSGYGVDTITDPNRVVDIL